MAETVGVGVLAADTGESVRTLQHWSDLGILQPLEATHKQGRGYHREFPAGLPHGERTWALIASALNRIRIPLADIKRTVSNLRWDAEREAKAGNETIYGRAIAGHPIVLFLAKDGAWYPMDLEDIRDKNFIQQKMNKWIEGTPPWHFTQRNSEGYFLNLTSILEPLRISA